MDKYKRYFKEEKEEGLVYKTAVSIGYVGKYIQTFFLKACLKLLKEVNKKQDNSLSDIGKAEAYLDKYNILKININNNYSKKVSFELSLQDTTPNLSMTAKTIYVIYKKEVKMDTSKMKKWTDVEWSIVEKEFLTFMNFYKKISKMSIEKIKQLPDVY